MSVRFLDESGELQLIAGKPKVETMTGATSEQQGKSGLVPVPLTSDVNKFLRGDGTYAEPEIGVASETSNGLLTSEQYTKIETMSNFKKIDITLKASEWDGTKQSKTIEDISKYNSANVVLDANATDAEATAVYKAELRFDYNGITTMDIYADGDIPTIDIKISIYLGTCMNVINVPEYIGSTGSIAFSTDEPSGDGVWFEVV